MKIIHENLQMEAESTAEVIKRVYGLESELINMDLEGEFIVIPAFNGYYPYLANVQKMFDGKAVLVVTPRDMYAGTESKDDDWILGGHIPNLDVVSTARLKRPDSNPSSSIEIPLDLYLKRLNVMAVHEIAHGVVKGKHLKQATWVNTQTGYKLELGPHCTDNTCTMYEIVDIKAPLKSEGYMLLGKRKKYDAGLDDVIARMNPKWLCDRCYSSIRIDESYR